MSENEIGGILGGFQKYETPAKIGFGVLIGSVGTWGIPKFVRYVQVEGAKTSAMYLAQGLQQQGLVIVPQAYLTQPGVTAKPVQPVDPQAELAKQISEQVSKQVTESVKAYIDGQVSAAMGQYAGKNGEGK